MKKILLVLLIIFLVPLNVVAETYKNYEYNIQFDLPKDWQVEPMGTQHSLIIKIDNNYDVIGTILIDYHSYMPASLSFDTISETYKAAFINNKKSEIEKNLLMA